MSARINAPVAGGGMPPEINVIMELKDTVFPQPGPYQFVVLVEKDHKGILPIFVNQVELQTPQQT